MGRRYIPYLFVGFLWLERIAQTLLKATTDDCAPTERMKAQARSKSSLMHVQNISVYAPSPHIQFGRKCSYFVCQLKNSCQFPLKRLIEFIQLPEYVTHICQFCDPFLVTCALMWVITLTTSINILLNFGVIFWLASISL